MKTLTIKSAILFIILNIFSVSIFANGVHFSLKVSNDITLEKLNNYSPIKNQQESLLVGEFDDYLLAMKARIELNKKGVDSTEIVAFFHKNQVSLDDAFTLLDNQIEQDKRISHSLSTQEMETMLANVQNHEFFYTIQMGVYNEKNANAFFNFPKAFDERITTKGFYRYTYGEFKTLQDAKDALRMVKKYDMDNVIIIAYDNMARIPLARAIEKEGKMLEDALALER